ncbi:CBS domain-containing protein CBSX6-like [Panicum miliaceum]|uniref:CBS domain-containing protein CBSX6-like n=1 Tax=Panicum miliaceum TaxID=4540 RepID=A0A3L6SZW6_PANMI|nr:CBS domain-containing protein CBSX6-like [Panicum miliaceum]
MTPAPAAIDAVPREYAMTPSFNDDTSSDPSAPPASPAPATSAGAAVDVAPREHDTAPDSYDDSAVSLALARMLLVAGDTPPVQTATVDGIPPAPATSLAASTAAASPPAEATITAAPPRAATTTTTLEVAPGAPSPMIPSFELVYSRRQKQSLPDTMLPEADISPACPGTPNSRKRFLAKITKKTAKILPTPRANSPRKRPDYPYFILYHRLDKIAPLIGSLPCASLTAGKLPLRGVPASAPLSAAAAGIPTSQEADVAVWRDGASPLAPAAATVTGLLSSFDVVAFLASHVGGTAAALRTPAGDVAAHERALVREVEPHTSFQFVDARLIEIVELMKQGARRFLVRKNITEACTVDKKPFGKFYKILQGRAEDHCDATGGSGWQPDRQPVIVVAVATPTWRPPRRPSRPH